MALRCIGGCIGGFRNGAGPGMKRRQRRSHLRSFLSGAPDPATNGTRSVAGPMLAPVSCCGALCRVRSGLLLRSLSVLLPLHHAQVGSGPEAHGKRTSPPLCWCSPPAYSSAGRASSGRYWQRRRGRIGKCGDGFVRCAESHFGHCDGERHAGWEHPGPVDRVRLHAGERQQRDRRGNRPPGDHRERHHPGRRGHHHPIDRHRACRPSGSSTWPAAAASP